MIYMRAITTKKSIYGEGICAKRAMVEDDLHGQFVEWQKEHDPAIKWVSEDFDGRSIYYIHNVKGDYREEWVFEGKWKIKSRRR